MFQAARYVRNSFSISFARQSDIRRKANDFEDALTHSLEGHYSQAHVIPVPDELDPEVPRLIFGSQHGFSQIIISQVSLVLDITYSPDWQVDIEKGRDYLLRRVRVLYELLTSVGQIQPHFSGLLTAARLPASASDKEILGHLSHLCLNDCFHALKADSTHDLLVKITTVRSGRFFNNLTVQNYRGWQFEGSRVGIRPFPSAQASERGLEIIGDFNDRYAFNEKKGYFSRPSVADDVISGGLSEVSRIIAEVGGAS